MVTFNVCSKITPNFIKIFLLQVNESHTFTLQQLCLITDSLHSKLHWTKMLWVCTNNTRMEVKFTSLPKETATHNYIQLMYLHRQTDGGEDVGFMVLTPYCLIHSHLHLQGWSNGVQWRTQEFCSVGGGFNKFSWGQRERDLRAVAP